MNDTLVTREVIHKFTSEEIDGMKDKFISDTGQIDQVLEEKAASAKEFNEIIKAMKKKQSELLTKIRTRSEIRQVRCKAEPNFKSGMMEFYDAATGEMVDERRLLPEERQTSLPLSKVS